MVTKWKCHVQERPATNEAIQVFFPFSPVIADQYLFIFVKLEEDNICLFYNFPLGQIDSETRSCLHGQVRRYCFNEFNDKDNLILLNFRESKKGRKGNSSGPFS